MAKKITANGQPRVEGKNFLKAHRGERYEFVSPTGKHLKGYFVSKFWHSGTEFVIFKVRQRDERSVRRIA
jgi:hypothetical protein